MSSTASTDWIDEMWATCRLCGVEADHSVLTLREMQFGSRETFNYFQCNQCGTVQIGSIPTDLSRHYPANYYSFLADPEGNPHWSVRAFFHCVRLFAPLVRFGLLSPSWLGRAARSMAAKLDLRLLILDVFQATGVNKSASILDVGSGAGFIPYCLKQVGFRRVVGLDPFLKEDRLYRNGFVVLKQDLESFVASNPEPFDLIMFHHSLEHMSAPETPLKSAASILAADGVILVRVPVVDCDAFDHYRENLVELDPPRHLFVPTQKSMAVVAERVGLVIERTIHDSTEFQFWASEQYVRGIPLESERSYRRNRRAAIFSKSQLRDFRWHAIECNRRGRGDTAAFILRKKGFANGMAPRNQAS